MEIGKEVDLFGLRLVKRRGELMGEHGEGGMLALGLDANAARLIADRHYCQVASINLPEQTVVGGRDADLETLAAEMERVNPRKRAVRLATEGAFHTYLMVEAARRFRETLDATEFGPPLGARAPAELRSRDAARCEQPQRKPGQYSEAGKTASSCASRA